MGVGWALPRGVAVSPWALLFACLASLAAFAAWAVPAHFVLGVVGRHAWAEEKKRRKWKDPLLRWRRAHTARARVSCQSGGCASKISTGLVASHGTSTRATYCTEYLQFGIRSTALASTATRTALPAPTSPRTPATERAQELDKVTAKLHGMSNFWVAWWRGTTVLMETTQRKTRLCLSSVIACNAHNQSKNAQLGIRPACSPGLCDQSRRATAHSDVARYGAARWAVVPGRSRCSGSQVHMLRAWVLDHVRFEPNSKASL